MTFNDDLDLDPDEPVPFLLLPRPDIRIEERLNDMIVLGATPEEIDHVLHSKIFPEHPSVANPNRSTSG